MAGSRVYKVYSVFDRVTSLLEKGVLKTRPLWYDVYQAHPPKYDPRYDRKAPEVPIKPILYEEDVFRAEMHKKMGESTFFNLMSVAPSREMANALKEFTEIMDKSKNKVSFERAIKMTIASKSVK